MTTDLKEGKYRTIIEYAAVILSGCIFVLLSASWTSPVFPYAFGYDSSWYSLMGRAITRGYVPYRDYFDLKGPVFFMIEAIGQFLITGRGGIVLIECIACGVSALMLWKTARLTLRIKKSVLVLGAFYFCYIFLLWGGNTCEEYMMPFNLACIYLALKYITGLNETAQPDPEGRKEDPFLKFETPAFLFGVSFAVMVLSKVTVAAPMGGAALIVVIELIRRKRAKLLLPVTGLFLCGAAFVAVPVFAYFAMNHALERFIYCAFTFAFRRSTDYYEAFSLDWEKNLLICYVVFLFAVTMKIPEKTEKYRKNLLILLSAFTFLALHLGTPYTYYFITELPVFALFLIEFLNMTEGVKQGKIKLKRLMLAEVGMMVILAFYWRPVTDKINENFNLWLYPSRSYYDGVMEVMSFIPEGEEEEIYDLESGMIFYEMTGLLPTNPYPVNLPYFLHLDPRIKTEVLHYLQNKRPRWIISEDMQSFDDDDVKEYVFSHYEMVLDTDAEELYLRVD